MDKQRKRLDPEERTQQLLNAGYEMAQEDGLGAVNRVQLGKRCGVTDGLVSKYFGNAKGMYLAIIKVAVKEKDIDVLADAVEMGYTQDIPPALLTKARKEAQRREHDFQDQGAQAAFA